MSSEATRKWKLWSAIAVVLVSGLAARGAENPTAFQLAKEGDRYVGEQCKDKVVQIRSERSVGSLVPNVWYVVYYDPTATLKAAEVKFGAAKMLAVKRPLRLLEPVTGADLPLDFEKLKVDSDIGEIWVSATDGKVVKTDLHLDRLN